MNSLRTTSTARCTSTLARALALLAATAGCVATAAAPSPTSTGNDIGPDSGHQDLHAIVVSIDDIAEAVGTIRVALFSNADSYAAREPIAALYAPANSTTLNISLGEFPDGDYAVMVFHDKNGNETLDRNLLGIPSEPWTGSLRHSVSGAPDWDDVRFELNDADQVLTLAL